MRPKATDLAVAQTVEDQGEELTGGSHLTDIGATAFTNAQVVVDAIAHATGIHYWGYDR